MIFEVANDSFELQLQAVGFARLSRPTEWLEVLDAGAEQPDGTPADLGLFEQSDRATGQLVRIARRLL